MIGRGFALAALGALMAITALPAMAQLTQARVEQGALSGTRAGAVGAFRGVPFAAPPVGANRWAAPRPAATWQGTRPATAFSPSCRQDVSPAGFGPWTHEYVVSGPVSEDCLYLNVWTPAKRAGEKLAVLVWIHGGAFTSGSASVPIYDGAALAKRGIVVVGINYRLGLYGFLAHPGLSAETATGASGNYGLMDQIAALIWVKRNIAAFGGDPARITIAGQSAGAASVHHLIAAPGAEGLFARAIAQSGSGMGLNVASRAQAEKTGLAFAQAAGAADIMALRGLSPEALEAAARKLPPGAGPGFAPIADGLVLPEGMVGANGNDTPILTGMTAEEMTGLNPAFGRMTPADVTTQLNGRFGALAPDFAGLYPAPSDALASEAFAAFSRDRGLAAMAFWADNRLKTSRQPIYAYLWSHAEPGPDAPRYRAFHSSEIPYVFETLDAAPERGFGADDRRLSALLAGYWVNWVKTGDPNGAGLPRWSPYTTSGRQILGIGATTQMRPVLDPAALALYARYVASGGALGLF